MKRRRHAPEQIIASCARPSGCLARARSWRRWPSSWRSPRHVPSLAASVRRDEGGGRKAVEGARARERAAEDDWWPIRRSRCGALKEVARMSMDPEAHGFAYSTLPREIHRAKRPTAGMDIWLGANAHEEPAGSARTRSTFGTSGKLPTRPLGARRSPSATPLTPSSATTSRTSGFESGVTLTGLCVGSGVSKTASFGRRSSSCARTPQPAGVDGHRAVLLRARGKPLGASTDAGALLIASRRRRAVLSVAMRTSP